MKRMTTQTRILMIAFTIVITSVIASGAGQKILSIFAAGKSLASPKIERLTIQREAAAKTMIKLSQAKTLTDENSLERLSATPLAMVVADFNEDGTPEVVAAYGGAGLGSMRIFRGNPEAIYGANSLTNAVEPFLSNAPVLALSATPDFIEAGDFNGDAHQDVIFASRLGQKLFLLSGDGKGGFDEAKEISVSGQITAMTAGEFNHHDGVIDLALAIQAESKFEILLYQNSQSAMSGKPKSFAVAQPVTALTLGQMNNDVVADLAAAAGNNLYLVEARDEALTVTTQVLPFTIQSMAVGRFDTLAQDQLAVLAENDEVYAMRAPQAQVGTGRRRAADRFTREWRAEKLSGNTAQPESVRSLQGHKTLLKTRISTSAYDDLMILDSTSKTLNILSNAGTFESTKISLENENAIVAALPMRLNASALNGLVMLRAGQSSPSYAVPEAAMTFTVTTAIDLSDETPGDGLCAPRLATGSVGPCTLRAAIQEANANAGVDTIVFNIGSGTQSVLVFSALPAITEPLNLIGTPPAGAPATQSIVIEGSGTGTSFSTGIVVRAGNSLLRSLTITGFFDAMNLNTAGGNKVENCTIQNNGGDGIVINNSPNNTIGAPGVTSNVIIANGGDGIYLTGGGSTGNLILQNNIGIVRAGTDISGNQGDGIFIAGASNNSIGASPNLIGGNGGDGITITRAVFFSEFLLLGTASGNLIQGNRIGTDANGTATFANKLNGILLEGANNTTIRQNVIKNNSSGVSVAPQIILSGLTIPAGRSNFITNNSISGNAELGIELDGRGISFNDPGDGDVGANNLQNYPVLTFAYSTAQGVGINGTLNSTPNMQFPLEFFSNTACDSSGYGEGETYLGTTTVTTDASGNASFSFQANLGSPLTVGRFITATATDTNGNTSEFSACAAVQAAAELSISQTVTPSPAISTGVVTYTVTVVNGGLNNSVSPSVRIDMPIQLSGVTCTAPLGWTCSQDGAFFASTANFAPGSAVFTLRGTLPCLAQNTTLTSVARISAGQTLDPISTNNSSTLATPALAGTAVGIVTYDGTNPNALSLGPVVVGSGNAVSGTFTLENTGCLPMNLTTAQFQRQISAQVPSLGSVDDARYFAVRLINADGTETALNPSGIDRDPVRLITLSRTLNPAQRLRFRVLFNPPLPFFAGTFARSDLGLNASQVLPSQFNSRLTFNFITGANPAPTPTGEAVGDAGTAFAALIGNTAPAVQIIPRDGLIALPGAPLVVLEQIREDFRVKVSMYDANKNINKITYQFIDTFNQLVGKPIEVALTQPLSASSLLPGQCFTLQVDFQGAAARPDVTKVRVVVTDDDGTSVTAGSPGTGALASPATVLLESLAPSRSDVIVLQPMSLSIDGRTDTVISRDTNSRKGNE